MSDQVAQMLVPRLEAFLLCHHPAKRAHVIAVGGGHACHWDTGTGKVEALPTPAGPVSALWKHSPTEFLLGHGSGWVHLYSIRLTRGQPSLFPRPLFRAGAAVTALLSDGKAVTVGLADGHVLQVGGERLGQVTRLWRHAGPVRHLLRGDRLYSAAADGLVRADPAAELPTDPLPPVVAATLVNPTTPATVHADGSVRVWRSKDASPSGQRVRRGALFVSDGQSVYHADEDGRVLAFDIDQMMRPPIAAPPRRWRGLLVTGGGLYGLDPDGQLHRLADTAASAEPDGWPGMVAVDDSGCWVGTGQNAVRRIRVPTAGTPPPLPKPPPVTALGWNTALVACRGEKVSLLDPDRPAERKRFLLDGRVTHLAVGTVYAVTATARGQVVFWQLADRTAARSVRAVGPVLGLTVDPTGQRATCSDALGRRITLDAEGGPPTEAAGGFDVGSETGQLTLLPQQAHAGPVKVRTQTPDGRFVATAGVDRLIRVWQVHGDHLVPYAASLTDGLITALAWSAEAPRLAWADGDGRVGVLTVVDNTNKEQT